MLLFLKALLAVFYTTQVLLFKERTSHFGPFPSKTQFVFRQRSHYSQPVTLFDRIRRWTLNPYTMEDENELWYVNEQKMERWSCPKCLSLWVSLAATLFITIFIDRPKSLSQVFEKLIFLVALAGSTTLLSSVYDRLNDDGMRLRTSTEDSKPSGT